MKRLWSAGLALVMLAAMWGCSPDRVVTAPEPAPDPSTAPSAETAESEPSASSIAWLDVPLTDAVTGREFRLSDYKGKPVLLHAFAVW